MLHNILTTGSLTPRMTAQLKAAGWIIFQAGNDYIEIEYHAAFNGVNRENGLEGDKPAFVAQFTFDWETLKSNLELGTDEGDGFTSMAFIEVEEKHLVDQISAHICSMNKTSNYYHLTQNYPFAHADIIKGVQRLSEVLKLTDSATAA